MLQSSRRCPAITRLGACSRPTSHHMDPLDPPGHGNIGDWCSRAGWGQIVGCKSQRRDATADRFAPWWWWGAVVINVGIRLEHWRLLCSASSWTYSFLMASVRTWRDFARTPHSFSEDRSPRYVCSQLLAVKWFTFRRMTTFLIVWRTTFIVQTTQATYS